MSQEIWTAVDGYYGELLLEPDPVLQKALQSSTEAGMPSIQVSAMQGKFLYLLARSLGAKSILEVGTLGAYSTIWLARALPKGGRMITLEVDPNHAAVARENLARAELTKVVELILGPAIETLPKLQSRGPFDLIFIDADKPSTAEYFDWALKLSRPGTMVIVDNVVRKGAVIDSECPDSAVKGIRKFNERLAAEKRVSATAIQTVGAKGYDGFAMALVL